MGAGRQRAGLPRRRARSATGRGDGGCATETVEPRLQNRGAPEGQVASIELPGIAELLGEPTFTGAYGLLISEDPGVSQRPAATPRPEPDEGPHLSYAFQWFLFALLGFVGLGFAVRTELRDPDAPQPRSAAPMPTSRTTSSMRRTRLRPAPPRSA